MKKVLGAISAIIIIILIVTAGWLIWAYHDSKHLRRQERVAHLKARGYQEVIDSDGLVKFVKVMPDGSIKAVRVKGITPTAGLPRMTTTPTGKAIVSSTTSQVGSQPLNQTGATEPQKAAPIPQTGAAVPQTASTASQTTAATRTEPVHSAIVAMSATPTSHSQVSNPIMATSPTTTTTTTSLPGSQATKRTAKQVRYGPNGEKIVGKYKVKMNQSGNVVAVKYKAKVKSGLHGKKATLTFKQGTRENCKKNENQPHASKVTELHEMPTNHHEGMAYKMKIKAVHPGGISKSKVTGEVDSYHPHKIHQGTLANVGGAPMKPHPTIEYRLRVKYFGAENSPLYVGDHQKDGNIVHVAHISKHHKHALKKHLKRLRKTVKKSLKCTTPNLYEQQQKELPHRVTTIQRDTHSTKFCKSDEPPRLPSRSQVQFKKYYMKPHNLDQHVKLKIVIFQHHFHDLLGHKHKVETHHWDDPHHPGLHTVKVKRHLIRLNREYEPMVPHLPEDHNCTEQHQVNQGQSHKMVVPPHVYHQNHHFFRGFKNIWQLPDRKYNHHVYQCWNNVPQEVAFDPKYYGHHKNVIIEVPRDEHGKPVPVDDETHVIFCVRSK